MSLTQEVLSVSHSQLLEELKDEYKDLNTFGTSYRKETVELSLRLVEKVKNPALFVNRNSAYQTVVRYLDVEDEDRRKDVAKMLNVLLLDIHSKAHFSEQMKTQLLQRKMNRKPYRLVPVYS